MKDERPSTDEPKHPARSLGYDGIIDGLKVARERGFVHRRHDPASRLQLYIYTSRRVFDDGWDAFSMLARGLVVDPDARRTVATPFAKFFNLGEKRGEVPDLPFEAFEKLDGSLIVAFHHAGRWRCATKGAFDSDQAAWARSRLDAAETSHLVPGTTYLFEAVYSKNSIVVRYDDAAMVLLAAYAEDGRELSYDEVLAVADALGWRAARRIPFATIREMVAHAEALPKGDEGVVVRFSDGSRLKVKGAEYRRIHALISRCTPLAMWEAMNAGDDMDAIRRDLPEEFWRDFDEIVRLLRSEIGVMEGRIAAAAASVAHLSDKELGLALRSLPKDVSPYLFGYRKAGAIIGRQRDGLMRAVRPTGNALAGYRPSYALGRALEEAMS